MFAPKAKAQLDIKLNSTYQDLIDNFDSKFKLKSKTPSSAVYRVEGDFFSELAATQVAIGKTANPNHYSKVGFDLCINQNDNSVTLTAEERVILGYLELKAVGVALKSKLDNLVVNYT